MRVRTPQQEAAVAWFREPRGPDLLLTARAGSGKTRTILDGVAERPISQSVLLCAFARRNAEELSARVREESVRRAWARTLHGVGRRAIVRALGRDVVPNGDREFLLAERVCGEQTDRDVLGAVAQLARMAKEIAPDEVQDRDRIVEIAMDFGLAGDDDSGVGWGVDSRARAAMDVIEASHDLTEGVISFADMLYLPLALNMQPDQAELVTVDEAQDMNLAQLRLAAKVRRRGGRIAVVGDPRQAIYSWRGAAPGALEFVAERLNAMRLALTVSWRCGVRIIELARTIVPDIEPAPGAPDGIVRELREHQMDPQPGDFVLSRTNAPLGRICTDLLKRGVRARIVGGEVGDGVIALVSKLARQIQSSEIPALLGAVTAWHDREIKRAEAAKRPRRIEQVRDQAGLVIALSELAPDVGGLIATIERLFADDGRPAVMCSTIHRAKGLEADRVWILRETLDQMQPSTPIETVEEANIRYVAITRARRELVWVTP